MTEKKNCSEKKSEKKTHKESVEHKKEKHETKKSKEQELQEQLNEYKTDLQRLQAEFENYKKRIDKEQVYFKEFANASFAKEFLPILDSFEQAINEIQKTKNYSKEDALKGLNALNSQFKSLLTRHGLKEIETLGKKFDPEYHEVLMLEQNPEKEDELIVEEFQKGYLFKDKVLRHSKVKVNRHPEENSKNANNSKNVNNLDEEKKED